MTNPGAVANSPIQDPVVSEPLNDYVAMCAARQLCIETTLDKLRQYNETGEAFTHALKDWPSHPSAPTKLADPIEDDNASQETSHGAEVSGPLWNLEEHFRDAKKAVPAKFGLRVRKKKKLVKAIKEAKAALEVSGDLKEAEGSKFYEDGAPGNHSDLAIFLNNLGSTVKRELVQVLQTRSSGTQDYENLTTSTHEWAIQIKNKLDEALELRREFMRLSKVQFKGAKVEVSALILEKFRWRGNTVSDFEW